MNAATCPCGSGRAYAACCGPLIDGARPAATAEALMRSRYTAHVVGAIDYLLATVHSRERPRHDRDAVRRWAQSATWSGLEILATRGGGPADDAGEVDFIARSVRNGAPAVHRERSLFQKEGGCWRYLRALPTATLKAGRNDPCPCGSGRKFKKCCGA